MTRFDAETCSVSWPGLELAIHSGTVRDLAFVSRASGTPVLVSGGAGMYHFCVVLLTLSELIGNVNLIDFYETWPKCLSIINAPNF